MKKILFSVFLCIFVCACSNYKELNDYNIATALGIDFQNNQYQVNYLIQNVNSSNKALIYSGKGSTIYDAVKRAEAVSNKDIYKGHLSIIVISENVAKKGLKEPIKFLLTESQSRKDFYIFLSKDTNSLNILKSTSFTSTSSLIHKIQKSNNINDYIALLKQLISKKNIILTGYSIINNNSNKLIKTNTLGYFKNDKLIGWANKDESKGINIINNNINQLSLRLKCNNGYINVYLNHLHTQTNINKYKKVTLNIKGNSYIKYSNCDNNNVEEQINRKINSYINKALTLSKEQNVDLFGIEQLYYQNYPNNYNKKYWENNFNKIYIQYYNNIKFKINNINVKIERIIDEKNN